MCRNTRPPLRETEVRGMAGFRGSRKLKLIIDPLRRFEFAVFAKCVDNENDNFTSQEISRLLPKRPIEGPRVMILPDTLRKV